MLELKTPISQLVYANTKFAGDLCLGPISDGGKTQGFELEFLTVYCAHHYLDKIGPTIPGLPIKWMEARRFEFLARLEECCFLERS